MKISIIISLPLLVGAGLVERRQFGISYTGTPRAPLTTTKLSPKVNSTAIREKLVWGPYRLGAANVCMRICNLYGHVTHYNRELTLQLTIWC
jgi:hypothetical protein